MIIEEIKGIASGRKELRQFGITIGIVMTLVGIWLAWSGEKGSFCLFIVAGFFILFAFVLPVLLKPFHKGWMTFALLMGWLVTRVILIFLFYVVVAPIGLLARLCGKDFLSRRLERNVESYWIPRKTIESDNKNYENQF